MEYFTLPLQLAALAILGLSLVLVMYRVLHGPHILDRVMCIDGVALIVVCLIAVWNVRSGTTFFFDSILLLAIAGFVSTVAVCKYLERGDVIE